MPWGLSGSPLWACPAAASTRARARGILPDLVTRAVLASSTCSFDLPGARATWSNDDRVVYTFASRAPWLFRLMFAKFIHDVRRDPTAIFPMMKSLGPADQETLRR
jgi:hypothetical protein